MPKPTAEMCQALRVSGLPASSFPLAHPRLAHTSTLLLSGEVLILGGTDRFGGEPLQAVEIYDPASRSLRAAAPWMDARFSHSATLMTDGRVLVVGGNTCSARDCVAVATSQYFDPATGDWTAGPELLEARSLHGAELLDDGSVLIMGGQAGFVTLRSAEKLNPSQMTFEAVPSMFGLRTSFGTRVDPRGDVWVMGGQSSPNPSIIQYTRAVEIFDPATNTWRPGPSMLYARVGFDVVTATDGTIIVAGGQAGNNGSNLAESWTPGDEKWLAMPALSLPRGGPGLISLPTGEVLAIGGAQIGNATTQTVERLNSERSAWSPSTALSAARGSPTTTLLADCSILVVGGYTGTTVHGTAELLVP